MEKDATKLTPLSDALAGDLSSDELAALEDALPTLLPLLDDAEALKSRLKALGVAKLGHRLKVFGVLQRSFLSEFLPLDDMHEVHVFAGKVVGFEVISHSFWHLLRWGLAGEIQLLWTHVAGITGLIALLVTPLIVWPMQFQKLRKKIPFE